MSAISGTNSDLIVAEGVQVARVSELDRVRGVAVVLMMLDHLASFFPSGEQWLSRHTATRFALPLFCLLAGALYKPEREFKYWVLVGIGLAMSKFWEFQPFVEGRAVDVLVLIAAGLIFMRYLLMWPLFLFCLLQPMYWSSDSYFGYQVGFVFVLLAFGHSLGREPLVRFGAMLSPWWSFFGRRPLVWYVVHLLVLGGVRYVVVDLL